MSEETELILEIWGRVSEFVHADERPEAAEELLKSFVEHGHEYVIEELKQEQANLEKSLSVAVLAYEEE